MKAIRLLPWLAALACAPSQSQDAPLEASPPAASETLFRSRDATNEFDVSMQVAPMAGEALGNDEFELVLTQLDPVPAAEVFSSGFETSNPPSPDSSPLEDQP